MQVFGINHGKAKRWRKRAMHALVFTVLMTYSFVVAVPVEATTCPTSGTDVTISVNCTFDAGTYTFSGTLTIDPGVVVTAASNVGGGQVVIESDSIVVNGTISANGTGFGQGSGPGAGLSGGAQGGGGAYGGDGANGAQAGGTAYGSVKTPTDRGSGGGSFGGAGGGSIKLSAPSGTITIDGSVTANAGTTPGTGGGGGSGGSIWIDAGTFAGSGTVNANGGNRTQSGGDGGGGRIAIYYDTDSSTMVVGTGIRAVGGTAGGDGGAGTVFVDDKDDAFVNGDLYVDNGSGNGETTTQTATTSLTFDNVFIRNGGKYLLPSGTSLTVVSGGTFANGSGSTGTVTVNSGATLDLTDSIVTISNISVTLNGAFDSVTDLTIGPTSTFVRGSTATFTAGLADLTVGNSGSGTFQKNGTDILSLTNLTVNSGGIVTHGTNTTAQNNSLDISATTVTVNLGGSIDVDGKGYSQGNGPGGGTSSGAQGSGGAHGGNGASGASGSPGTAYGSAKAPIDLGSGGGAHGGAGGGQIKLAVSGTLTIDGTVSADAGATPGTGGGGGAGGSVWIDVGTLDGDGAVTASGADRTQSGGSGGGGRIAVEFATDASTLVSGDKLKALGASAGTPGGAGTIFIDDTDDGLANGSLIVDNDNRNGASSNQTTGTSLTFDKVTIREGGKYVVPGTSTLSIPTTGTLTGGGTVQPSLTIASGGVFNPPTAAFEFNDIDVTNSGTISTVTDLSVTAASMTLGSTGAFTATVTDVTLASSATFTHQGGSGLDLTTLSIPTGSTFNLNTEIADPLGTSFATADVSGTFSSGRLAQFSLGALTVFSGGTVTHGTNTTAKVRQLDLAATSIDVQTGGTIHANGRGFANGEGPGKGNGTAQGGGGGYGGDGANASSTGGNGYGSVTQPSDLGSGGSNQGSTGGEGGGAIKLTVSGTLTVNGTIASNGATGNGTGAGGGSGGSVWLDVATLAGSGSVTANGGERTQSAGAGGGGRIAIYYATDSSTVISGDGVKALGATAGTDGGAGTIFLDDTDDALVNGTLIVDNDNLNGESTTHTVGAAVTVDELIFREGAKYVIPSTSTLALATGGTLTSSGTIQPTLTINSGGTFTGPSTFDTTTINVTNNGSVTGVTDLTIASGVFTNNGTVAMNLTDLVVATGGTFIQTSDQALFSGSTLTIENGGTFTQNNDVTIAVTTLTVESGGTLNHGNNSTTRAFVIDIAATTIDIQSGATVTANGLGFDSSEGTGQGTDGAQAGGGGYGGDGGDGTPSAAAGGTAYGSSSMPTDLGSGGGDDTSVGGQQGGAGGGAIKFNASGTLTVNGDITANGANATANEGGGGSGGSVWLIAGTWAGSTGTIVASGGTGGGNDTTGGGCGAGGRIRVTYSTKTYTGGAITANAGSGCTGVRTGDAGTAVEQANAPTIDSQTHSPSNPTTTDPVTLSVTASYAGNIKRIDLYLNGSPPGSGLVHTCIFSPAQSPATCAFNVGTLANATHTFTAIVTGDDDTTTQSQDIFSINGATSSGTLTLSRLAAGTTNVSLAMMFTLSAADTGSLTVTFPAQFTITSAFTTGSCSGGGTIDTFGFTSTTLTATKNSCAGTVSLSGAVLTNPATPGEYLVTWSNDSGSAVVVIVDDDQVNVSGDVDPELSFNVGSQAAATACDGTFSGNGGTIPLGALTTASVASSDASSVPHVCTRVTTNSTGGATVAVRSLNAALTSISSPADELPSSTATLVAGTEGYGLCVGSAGTDTGTDVSVPAGATPAAVAPFGSACGTGDHNVGGLTTSLQSLFTLSGASQNAFARIYLKAAISPGTPAHDDYTDVLTFIVSAEY